MKEEEKVKDIQNENLAGGERTTRKVRNCECVYLTKRCVLFRKLLTEEEVRQIEKLSARSVVEGWGSEQRRNFGKTAFKKAKYPMDKTGGHTVIFMEKEFETKLPHIFSFMNKVILKTDRTTGWNVLGNAKIFNPRRMEFLRYSPRGNALLKEPLKKKRNDGLGWHFDTDSLYSLVCMISHREDFTGGLLQFRVKQKKGGTIISTVPDFDRGDVVVFKSIATEHRVTATTGGVRRTFVYEIWDQVGYDDGTDTSSGCESNSSSTSSTDSFEIVDTHKCQQ